MKILLLVPFLCFSQLAYSAARKQPNGSQVNLNTHFNNLTTQQREALAKKYEANSCVNKTGLKVSCGFRTEWTGGDKSYNWDPYMNQIPRNSKVEVDVECNESTGKFHMNVRVPAQVCQVDRLSKTGRKNCVTKQMYLRNPYAGGGDDRVFQSEPTRWMASPGLYPDDRTDAHPDGLPRRSEGGRAVVSEYHVVSKNQLWENAQMLYALWIKGGYAIHGSNSVDGYPGSGGCIRLDQINAFALFNVARRVGPNNMNYNFKGYGRINPKTNQPFCAGPPGHREKILAGRKLISPEENKRSLEILEAALWERNRIEGRREIASLDDNSEPQRSVNSVKDKKKN